jgi:hypothetical protein
MQECPHHDPLQLRVEPFGPTQAELDAAAAALNTHPQLRAVLEAGETRLLDFALDTTEQAKRQTACVPEHFIATFYDYADNAVIEVRGALAAIDAAAPGEVQLRRLGQQPLPSGDEFASALEVVRHDRGLRERLDSGAIAAYRPMPPVIDRELPDGRIDRTLLVGLRSTRRDEPEHEVVGVRLFDRRLLRDLEGVVRGGRRVCEPPPGTDPPAGRGGAAGQCWITVTQGGKVLWRFLAVRPAASSGTNGSGIELKYVDYRGKRVLYQAQVPILNVEYSSEGQAIGCGPTYRDWQNAETLFEAQGQLVAPGFMLCSQPPRTIIESDSDSGNFKGVAIWVDGLEVVLVSEMQAGWYRYITQWRLHADGTIRPRFGFAGTENPCTCHLHIHHVYWRLDFDIRSAAHNRVEEYNDPPIIANNHWHTKQFEIRRPRDATHQRKWRVSNIASGDAYQIVPGAHDGSATPYGVGDLWVLRWHPGEIDDHQGFTTDPSLSRARLEPYMTPPEAVADADVVLWYAAHYVHDAGIEVGNYVGPDLVPERW